MQAFHHFKITEERFAMRERRSFCDRARADRLVGLWAASHLGLGGDAADAYADTVVKAGVVAPDGRGGFDKIAADLTGTTVHLEAIRTRYAIAMNETVAVAAMASRQSLALA